MKQFLHVEKIIGFYPSVLVILGACAEFIAVAHGTGEWWNGFAFSWALLSLLFCLACIFLIFALHGLFFTERAALQASTGWRWVYRRVHAYRWLLFALTSVIPVVIFQVSYLGIIFQGVFIRLLVWGMVVLLLALFSSNEDTAVSLNHVLGLVLLTGGIFAISAALQHVTDYPFSLTWSEGNRFWDYSILFGRDRYIFPENKDIYVLLDPGRQFVGGLPFLLPGLTIWGARLWTGLMDVFPYLVLGLALFKFERKNPRLYLLLSLWASLFLMQGPIHSPLVFSAALIAAAWLSPAWIALPLVVFGSALAGVSRYTWIFAPAMWVLMLTLSERGAGGGRRAWGRMILLTVAALLAGVLTPELVGVLQGDTFSLEQMLTNSTVAPGTIQERVSRQPLLWYRLLPNVTYDPGVLLGLLAAVGPLIILLYWLVRRRAWQPTLLQTLTFLGTQSAFLVVGLIVSTKIGGGADLHNLDMFLIGLVMLAAIAWRNGGREWLAHSAREPFWVRSMLVALVLIPAVSPLMQMRSRGYTEIGPWLATLAGAENGKSLGLVPSAEAAASALNIIRSEVQSAQMRGDILFMDQRQLLTFGYIEGVPLVPEYDKKVLIERSFTQSREYFDQFYADLAQQRFSLIIAPPQTTLLQGDDQQFSEENNHWVEWVARPLMCYYQVERTLPEVDVQLLTPRPGEVDCSGELP